MIAYLKGKLLEKSAGSVILDVGGVGYELFLSTTSLSELPAKGEETSLYTHLHVREDLMQLYGFTTFAEKDMFLKLTSITGIGPKVALSILSVYPPGALRKAILGQDVELMMAIPGIGKKSAQRIIIELKEKLELPELEVILNSDAGPSSYAEAKAALMNLGYTALETKRALEGFPFEDKEASAEDLIKYALKNLGSR